MSMGDQGGLTPLIKNNVGFRHGVYIYNGIVTNETIGEAFELPWKPIELLIAAL
jgi:alanine dehydrogenase